MKTAIITGASSGLGREFVRQLSRDDETEEFWVIARSQQKLEELKNLTDKPVRVLAMDLTDPASFDRLEELLQQEQPDVRWLIGSAGMGSIGKVTDMDRHQADRMIELNVRALADVTALVLPYCHAGSGIIEIGSVAGFQPMPGFGIYGATKAFVENYTKALAYDLIGTGIRATCACPYWVTDTNFIPTARQTQTRTRYRHPFLTSKAESVVRVTLWFNRCHLWVATPGIICTLQRFFAKFIPHFIVTPFMDLISRI